MQKNNPEAIGRGIGKIAKLGNKFNPKFGGFIKTAASIGSAFALKGSYTDRLTSAIKGKMKVKHYDSSYMSSQYNPQYSSGPVRKSIGYSRALYFYIVLNMNDDRQMSPECGYHTRHIISAKKKGLGIGALFGIPTGVFGSYLWKKFNLGDKLYRLG